MLTILNGLTSVTLIFNTIVMCINIHDCWSFERKHTTRGNTNSTLPHVETASRRVVFSKLISSIATNVMQIMTFAAINATAMQCDIRARLSCGLYVLAKFVIYTFLFFKSRLVRPLSRMTMFEKFVGCCTLGMLIFAGIVTGLTSGILYNQICVVNVPVYLVGIMSGADTMISIAYLRLFLLPLRTLTRYESKSTTYKPLLHRNAFACILAVVCTVVFMIYIALVEFDGVPRRELVVTLGTYDLTIDNCLLVYSSRGKTHSMEDTSTSVPTAQSKCRGTCIYPKAFTTQSRGEVSSSIPVDQFERRLNHPKAFIMQSGVEVSSSVPVDQTEHGPIRSKADVPQITVENSPSAPTVQPAYRDPHSKPWITLKREQVDSSHILFSPDSSVRTDSPTLCSATRLTTSSDTPSPNHTSKGPHPHRPFSLNSPTNTLVPPQITHFPRTKTNSMLALHEKPPETIVNVFLPGQLPKDTQAGIPQ